MNTFRVYWAFAFASFFSACDSGSSSGGESVALEKIVYTGSYETGVYNGRITIDILNGTPTVIMTGVSCLQSAFSDGLKYEVIGATVNVGGNIKGQPNGRIGAPADFGAAFPVDGGTGRFVLDPGAPCFSSVGTVTMSKS